MSRSPILDNGNIRSGYVQFPGLKPWAKSYCPFRAENVPNPVIFAPFVTLMFLKCQPGI